jgi:hypothetical protein
MIYSISILLLSFSLLVISPAAWAADESEFSATKSYEELQQEITHLKGADLVRDKVIKNLIRRIEQLERSGVDELPDEEQPSPRADTIEKKELAPEVKERLHKESEENYQLIQEAFEQRLGRGGGMLLAPYTFTYEPSISYSHASYDSIVVDGFTIYPVLVIGDIVSEKVRRDVVTNNHSFRLGLPRNMQVNLLVPLSYERKRSFRDDGTHVANETKGLGDISLALSYQLTNRARFWPDTVVGISWKSTSGDDPYRLDSADVPALGSGFETWGVSMTSMTTADPIVLFGGLAANYTPGHDKKIGHVSPGESYGINLGMALSLNLDTSLSFNYSYNYTLETKVNRQKINGSDLTTSTFAIGLSKAKSDLYAMDINLTIGLTRDSPDFQFSVSFPFEFSLKK